MIRFGISFIPCSEVDVLLERCCTTLQQVREALAGGAGRVELCDCIEVGGVTPSPGLIHDAVATGICVNVLVRPRGGDFVYNSEEVERMKESIALCRELGVHGVVIGALTPDGNVDMDVMRELMESASAGRRLSVTFHRAFDEASDPFVAFEDIISLGCDRLLTSGQKPTAPEGRILIRELARRADGRIIVMPGSGVTPDNVEGLAAWCGVSECHGTKLASK